MLIKKGKIMKCLLCLHYDVVKFECSHLAEKLNLVEDAVQTEPSWGCKEYKNASSKNIADKIKIDITIGV